MNLFDIIVKFNYFNISLDTELNKVYIATYRSAKQQLVDLLLRHAKQRARQHSKQLLLGVTTRRVFGVPDSCCWDVSTSCL